MKRVLALILALILSLPLVVKATSIQPPKGFEGDAFKATMLLHGIYKGQDRGFCTVAAYEAVPGGYYLVGAGHCVGNSSAWTYAVSDDVNQPATPVTVVKYEFDKKFDFAIFEMKTNKVYPIILLGTTDGVFIGDDVINPNFSLALSKQLSLGKVSSSTVPPDMSGSADEFLVQIFGSGGSSGSPVISAATHKIIGLVTEQFADQNDVTATIGMGVESIDNFQAFLNAPVVVVPHISDQEFKQKYGPDHAFMLTVQGPDPKFDFGGHTFQVDTGIGLELSDDYYYNVPVYIDVRDDGYWLVSTKEPNYGVEVKLLS